MGYNRNTLADIMKKLYDEGVNGVIIGDTTIKLALGYEELDSDIDLFVFEPSPLVEKERYLTIAERNNWCLSTTELGTISMIVPLQSGDLIIELYENYMDIDIPIQIFEDSVEYKIGGVKIKAIRPEHYVVLKARQGVDLDKLSSIIEELKRQKKLNIEIIKQTISLYPRSEVELIINRLRQVGLEVAMED